MERVRRGVRKVIIRAFDQGLLEKDLECLPDHCPMEGWKAGSPLVTGCPQYISCVAVAGAEESTLPRGRSKAVVCLRSGSAGARRT